jgi:DNA-3-methyladenine glycosylase II
MLGFLGLRALPELERVAGTTYERIGAGAQRVLSITCHSHMLGVSVAAGMDSNAQELRRDVQRVFDVAADSAAIDSHLEQHPTLRAAVRRTPGLRVPGAFDGFELAVRAILGQQVSVARATALARLLVQRYGADGHGGYAFPTPGCLARQTPAEIGMPGRRGEAIRTLAERVAVGDLHISPAMAPDALRAALMSIAGVGPWTAQYIAMRAGRDADAFPANDWVINRQLGTTPAAARKLAEAWRPFRAYAVMYLWSDAAHRRAA